ncbi:MAG: hypothetical protein GY834_15200 [Bacteroidetes bacterium]|nr:hypothetical protein [Bacteroidota bacterium]
MANTIRIGFQWFFLLLALFCSPQISLAQISDDFSDDKLLLNQLWAGDTNNFIINSAGQLQLNAPEAGVSTIYVQSPYAKDCEWRFFIQLAFSPSANNNARVYLTSNNENLEDELFGYFLQFGESGSADAIELFKQEGQSIISICRGTEGKISGSFALDIKVLRDEYGEWEIYTAQPESNDYVLEAGGYDNNLITSKYFGFRCKYTASNAKKIYFDNVYIGANQIDVTPPIVEWIKAISANKIEIQYSEAIFIDNALNANNYFVDKEVGNPELVQINEMGNRVTLFFPIAFENGITHTLSISNIEDLNNNQMVLKVMEFFYFEPKFNDVQINEVLADPSPAVGLPETEYLEIVNLTSFDLNLNNWIIKINESVKEFEEVILPKNSYLILCSHSSNELLLKFGSVYSFSSFLLPNSGSQIEIWNDKGKVISSFLYQASQFADEEKESGGWSLEQIDPTSYCLGADNWSYSTNPDGGSPGQPNSVNTINKPSPSIVSSKLLGDTSILIEYSMNMDSLSITDYHLYEIIETGDFPHKINFPDNNNKIVSLEFETPFLKNGTYTLKINSLVKNCLGITMTNDQFFQFSIPDLTSAYDIVINELLFRPLNQGEEYIEIYNRSDKILDLKYLEVCVIKNNFPHPSDTSCTPIASQSKMCYPEEYYVLTKSPDKVKDQYFTKNQDNFILVPTLGTLNNDGGIITISKQKTEIIDLVEYNESMHYPLLNFTEGVALERINFDRPSLEKSNWNSASFESGFGTPAYQNSQYSENKNSNDPILVSPKIFTPNNDGIEDLLQIEYQFNQAGLTSNIIIFNSVGVPVKHIVKNELLGTEGTFSWNGFDENNEKAPIGIYIIYVEVFDLNGRVEQYKKTAVLGEDFR